MGAKIEETKDGLIIQKSDLIGTEIDGHHDHRVIMALACAGLGAEGKTIIKNAENMEVTFPNFIEKMNKLGANLKIK